ncbi:hypothetical protein [Okeania sp. SIO2G5]|uniref:hypothetical protein n=1 Tax=Okeania sp. SIO2G5 TaxID=2607796 RepID=UPI0013C20194|nr:hypothetical protein [Okeania sp. SIO2G5]NEP76702.1 hypothetical protein [Okeania sp. SIO2G5]
MDARNRGLAPERDRADLGRDCCNSCCCALRIRERALARDRRLDAAEGLDRKSSAIALIPHGAV